MAMSSLANDKAKAKRRGLTRKELDAYGEGNGEGHRLARAWLANPHRGQSHYGGTLQNVILDLAERFKNASCGVEAQHMRGVIVGFSYAIECPEDAARLEIWREAQVGPEASHAQ